jgi:hypothetical protein
MENDPDGEEETESGKGRQVATLIDDDFQSNARRGPGSFFLPGRTALY